MADERSDSDLTLALSTKLEEDFVSPLTAARGALEILRDFPDLTPEERQRFVAAALAECERLERGVRHLAETVYAAGRRAPGGGHAGLSDADYEDYLARVSFHADELAELDLSGLQFTASVAVNAAFDVFEERFAATGRGWFIAVNSQDCSVWPEAWVAYAYRQKRLDDAHSRGTVRYATGGSGAPDVYPSREAALAAIAELRQTGPRRGAAGNRFGSG